MPTMVFRKLGAMNGRWSANILGPLLISGAGCVAHDLCADEIAACGGDPTGVWGIDTSCRSPAFSGPQRITYLSQPVAGTGEVAPESSSSDWCASLQYDPARAAGQKVTLFLFSFDALAVGGGTFRYEADGTYRGLMLTSGRAALELSESCITRFGAHPSCAEFGTELAQYAASQPSFRDVHCEDGSRGGCSCSYALSFDGSYNGRFMAQGGLLTHFSSISTLPSRADYCVSGDAMTMWGHDRTSLFDSPPGLRTLHLTRRE
jgi:hypothetical protein